MHAKALALLFVCTAGCDGPSAVPAKTAETVQTTAPAATPAMEPVKPVKPEATPEQVELTEEEMWKLIRGLYSEGIGPIKMDMPASEVIAAMGKPKSRGKEFVEGASGNLVQQWNYKGMKLDMARESKKATRKVAAIRLEKQSALTTKRGIRIGSTRAEVEKAYAKEGSAEDSDEATFVAGSVYGGLLFSIENDVVTAMFLGAAAE